MCPHGRATVHPVPVLALTVHLPLRPGWRRRLQRMAAKRAGQEEEEEDDDDDCEWFFGGRL